MQGVGRESWGGREVGSWAQRGLEGRKKRAWGAERVAGSVSAGSRSLGDTWGLLGRSRVGRSCRVLCPSLDSKSTHAFDP